jgi:small-conductance mechanosensitive channel
MSFVVAALAVAAVGSTYMSAQAASEQREARREQRAGARFKAKRERIAQVREALVRQSRIQNQASSQGVGGASGAMSGVGSVASQAASNISAIGSQLAIGNTVSRSIGKAQAYNQRATYFQTAGSLAALGGSLRGPKSTPVDPTLQNTDTGGFLQGPPQPGMRRPFLG